MARRIIICDGAESARLWSRTGADELEVLTWIPREGESRARPSGFKILQGGLDDEAIAKLEPTPEDEYALVSDDGPWTRLAVREIRKLDEGASILVLSDSLTVLAVSDSPGGPWPYRRSHSSRHAPYKRSASSWSSVQGPSGLSPIFL